MGFDFDDVRAEQGQLIRAVGTSENMSKVDDADAVQGSDAHDCLRCTSFGGERFAWGDVRHG